MGLAATRVAPVEFLMVTVAELSGSNQLPAAVHWSVTDDPAAISLGVAVMVIERTAAWPPLAVRMIMIIPNAVIFIPNPSFVVVLIFFTKKGITVTYVLQPHCGMQKMNRQFLEGQDDKRAGRETPARCFRGARRHMRALPLSE
jgi:hypothetical protein